MAASAENYGYEAEFSTAVPDELRCVICHLVLREPVQIMTCGHRYCAPCFKRIKIHAQESNADIICPIDREIVLLGHVFPDRAISRTIGNLKVYCGNRDQGCTWIDDLRDLKIHEEACQFKADDAVVTDERYGDLDYDIKQILLRMKTYEEDLIVNKKEVSQLRCTVSELSEDKKLKEEEIRLLKMSNAELKAESTLRETEIKALKRKVEEIQNELNNAKESRDQHGQEIIQLKSRSEMVENKVKELQQGVTVDNQITSVREEVIAAKEQLQQSITALKTQSFKHIENLESVQFAHQQLQTKNEVSFKWVMQDYLHMFRIGDRVYSPLFHTKVCGGYNFQLFITWSGSNKSTMDLYLELNRGKTPHRFLKDFNHEFTLTVHGKDGNDVAHRFSYERIAAHKKCFVIKKGEDTPESNFGFGILDAPYDDFILNDSLVISCTIHL